MDVLIGNEEDFTAALGYAVQGASPDLTALAPEAYASMLAAVARRPASAAGGGGTLRSVRTASRNDWGALAWSADDGFVHATQRDDLEILDRVGGGDSFASGLVYGLLTGRDLATAVEYGAAHGALAMTTPGDTSMATLAEVEALVRGAGARVQR